MKKTTSARDERRRFFLRNAVALLAECGQTSRVESLLGSLPYLKAKLEAEGTAGLLEDFDGLLDHPLASVGSAIRAAAHVLSSSQRELPGQLLGRIVDDGSPAIASLLGECRLDSAGCLLPTTPSIAQSPLIRQVSVDEHANAQLIDDYRALVVESYERTLLINLLTGETEAQIGYEHETDDNRAIAVNARCGYCAVIDGSRITIRKIADGKKIQTVILDGDGCGRIGFCRKDETLFAVSQDNIVFYDVLSGASIRSVRNPAASEFAWYLTDSNDEWVMASESDDQNLRFSMLRIIDLHTAAIRATLRISADTYPPLVALTPDGKRLVCTADSLIHVWRVPSWELEREIRGHSLAIECMDVSSTGRWLVTGSIDRSLRVWSIETGQLLAVMREHGLLVNSASFSPSEKFVLSSSLDGSLRLWDLDLAIRKHENARTQPLRWPHDVHSQTTVSAIACSPDSRLLLTGCVDESICFHDLSRDGATPLRGWRYDDVTGIRIDLQLYEVWGLAINNRSRGQNAGILAAAFSPDGRRVALASASGLIHLVDFRQPASRRAITEVRYERRSLWSPFDAATAIALGPRAALVVGGNLGDIAICTDSDQWQRFPAFSRDVSRIRIRANVVVASAGRFIARWTFGRWERSEVMELPGRILDFRVEPDMIVTVCVRDNGNEFTIEHIMDMREIISVATVPTMAGHGTIRRACFGPNEHIALIDGTYVRLWDLRENMMLKEISLELPVFCLQAVGDAVEQYVLAGSAGAVHLLGT